MAQPGNPRDEGTHPLSQQSQSKPGDLCLAAWAISDGKVGSGGPVHWGTGHRKRQVAMEGIQSLKALERNSGSTEF